MIPSDVFAFVRGALPEPPARVLEVGAGSGELAAALRDGGYDVLAIDPGDAAPGVERVALEAVSDPAAAFDAAVAVVSLHHVEPLEPSLRRLAELIRPGGRLVLDEIDADRYDARAARWWCEQRAALGEEAPEDAEAMVADLRHHIHRVARLREALAPAFALGEPVPGPYLHRWNLTPELRAEEERLIGAGALPATGVRLVGTRR